MKKAYLWLALASLFLSISARAISFDDIPIWTGSGSNRAALVIEWSSPESLTNSSVPVPVADKTLVWGYRFNGPVSGTQMLHAIVGADPRLYFVADLSFGTFVEGIGYNLKDDGIAGITDGTVTNFFTGGFLTNATVKVDAARAVNPGDLYWSGYFGPNWETWNEFGVHGGFLASPNRGTNSYWTADDPNAPYSGAHGQWQLSQTSLDSLSLTNGSWVGFSVAAGEYEPDLSAAYNLHKHAPPAPEGTYMAYVSDTNDFAIEIVNTNNIYETHPYNDPGAVLGSPTLRFLDYFGDKTVHRSKIIEPPYWTASDGASVITEISEGGQITAELGRKIYDDAYNPYGVDLIVFGNSFFSASGFSDDHSDLNSFLLGSGILGHPTTVSVSQDGTNWYSFTNAAALFPGNAYRWDEPNHSWTDETLNPTRPLNSSVYGMDFGGQSASSVLAQFGDSAGGSGYDLKESGLPWIQYVRIEAGSNNYTVIDAIAAAKPAVVGDVLSITPGNITSGITTLAFQKPSDASQNIVSANFSSLSGPAELSPIGLHELSSFMPISGKLWTAYQLRWKSLSGSDPVAFLADLRLRVPDNYAGDGKDLLVWQWNATNWLSKSFSFDATTHQVVVSGVTNFSVFAVTQIVAPELSIGMSTNGFVFTFTPIPNFNHVLQRSPDLVAWSPIASVTPTDSLPVTLYDTNAPIDKAFYRLQMDIP